MEEGYVCIGPHCFGFDTTKKGAIAKAKSYKPSFVKKWKHVVYYFDETCGEVTVSGFDGSVTWEGPGKIKEVERVG